MNAPAAAPRSIDVEVGHDRTVRVSLVEDEGGQALVVACGYGGGASGRPFHRPGWSEPPLRLPASAIPALRAALEELAS